MPHTLTEIKNKVSIIIITGNVIRDSNSAALGWGTPTGGQFATHTH